MIITTRARAGVGHLATFGEECLVWSGTRRGSLAGRVQGRRGRRGGQADWRRISNGAQKIPGPDAISANHRRALPDSTGRGSKENVNERRLGVAFADVREASRRRRPPRQHDLSITRTRTSPGSCSAIRPMPGGQSIGVNMPTTSRFRRPQRDAGGVLAHPTLGRPRRAACDWSTGRRLGGGGRRTGAGRGRGQVAGAGRWPAGTTQGARRLGRLWELPGWSRPLLSLFACLIAHPPLRIRWRPLRHAHARFAPGSLHNATNPSQSGSQHTRPNHDASNGDVPQPPASLPPYISSDCPLSPTVSPVP